MVGRRPEVGFQYRLPGWRRERSVRGLESDQHGCCLFKKLGVVELHGPAMLRLVVVVEDSQTVRHFAVQVVTVASPCSVNELSISGILRWQIEGIEDEGFSLRVERPPKCFSGSSLSVSIDDIDDMQIARAHDVAYLAPLGKHLALARDACRHFR